MKKLKVCKLQVEEKWVVSGCQQQIRLLPSPRHFLQPRVHSRGEEKGRESLELDENSEKGKQESKSRSGE